jgi:OFA family oxalate/formate antiporter-like MFS transporter
MLSDIFGNKHLSTIHGRTLTAWGCAGIAGPLLISYGKEILGDYTMVLYGFSFLFMINLVIAFWLNRNKELLI